MESKALSRWSCKGTQLKVRLKADAVPRRAKARRYAPKHSDFMRKQVKLLK